MISTPVAYVLDWLANWIGKSRESILARRRGVVALYPGVAVGWVVCVSRGVRGRGWEEGGAGARVRVLL